MLALISATQLEHAKLYFERTIAELDENDSAFTPVPGTYTAAQQIVHVAHVVDWFVNGAFGEGFDLDFEKAERDVRAVSSNEAARKVLTESFARAIKVFGEKTDEELLAPFANESAALAGAPKFAAIGGIVDHTAHHRGALAVYIRMLGRQPRMPYM